MLFPGSPLEAVAPVPQQTAQRPVARSVPSTVDMKKKLEGPPKTQFDYTFISDVGKTMQLKCLTMADVRFGGIMSSVVTKKGADLFTERLILSTLEEWGLQGDLIMQGDSESSLMHIIKRIASQRMGRI